MKKRVRPQRFARGSLRWLAILRSVDDTGILCPYCGEYVQVEEAEIDHITPVANGGTTTIENLVPVHARCNNTKSDGEVCDVFPASLCRLETILGRRVTKDDLVAAKALRQASRAGVKLTTFDVIDANFGWFPVYRR